MVSKITNLGDLGWFALHPHHFYSKKVSLGILVEFSVCSRKEKCPARCKSSSRQVALINWPSRFVQFWSLSLACQKSRAETWQTAAQEGLSHSHPNKRHASMALLSESGDSQEQPGPVAGSSSRGLLKSLCAPWVRSDLFPAAGWSGARWGALSTFPSEWEKIFLRELILLKPNVPFSRVFIHSLSGLRLESD